VVGEAAFGVRFDVLEKDERGHIKENPIVTAAKYVLENTGAGGRLGQGEGQCSWVGPDQSGGAACTLF
jgi:hypothetical protein